MDLVLLTIMNAKTNNTIKQILADPIGEYLKYHPNCEQSELDKLEKLSKAHHTLSSEFGKLDSKTRETSKKIGNLKKSGKDIGELKICMQALTKQKSEILQKSQDIESQVLAFFKLNNNQNSKSDTVRRKISNHVYADKTCEIDKISINLLEDDYTSWNHYAMQNKAASLYHKAEWRDLIKKTFGHNGYYLYASDQNNVIKGILPLIHMKSRLFGEFFISMPYFNYGGAIADHPDIENLLMSAADKHAATIPDVHIEYRDDIAHGNYPARTDKVNMILPLPPRKQDLWESFTPKLRAQIKRPQRENIEVMHGHFELLDDFYYVFARNMRDLGTPVYGKSLFHNILNTFYGQSRILIVRLDNKPVAAAFLLSHRDTLEIPWASSIHSVNHLSVNMLMYWEILSFAVEEGFKYFDFGRSSKEAGTYKFKKQWGAEPKQIYWQYWLPEGKQMPSLNPNNPKFNLAINIWRRLPIAITKLIGPGIVKNLP